MSSLVSTDRQTENKNVAKPIHLHNIFALLVRCVLFCFYRIVDFNQKKWKVKSLGQLLKRVYMSLRFRIKSIIQ